MEGLKKILLGFLKGIGRTISYLLAIVIIGVLVAANLVTPRYQALISNFLGHTSSQIEDTAKNSESTDYFTSDFSSEEEWKKAGQDLAQEVEEEGIVLLRNQSKALPLAQNLKVTLLGQNSVDFVYGGGGSGSVSSEGLPTLKDSMMAAGYEVNETVWDFYATGQGKDYRKTAPDVFGKGEFAVNEVPVNVYTDEVIDSFKNYDDVAVVVIGRTGGESADIPTTNLSTGSHYLELDSNEKALLEMANEHFEKVVVILNTTNTMELDFLETYEIDAAIWVGAVGQTGINAIGKVLNGDVNPSGHLTDTYAYDVFSAPAVANLGDYSITNSKVDKANKYLVYSEGIYVGYRYYETRYEDVVLGRENSGNYNYTSTVQYPFGYGLSYTDFEYSNYIQHETADAFEISVTVKNTGSVSGKEVVQLYKQSPYTEYDQKNGIEKSAVELVGFAKTAELDAGQSETVTITVPKEELKTYDSKGVGTYIVDAGTYYFTVAKDSHEAVNNILTAKGKSTANGMDENGNADMVSRHEVADLDTKTYSVSLVTGENIVNQFTDADIKTYDDAAIYLSRSNWEGTWPKVYSEGEMEATKELLALLAIKNLENENAEMPITGTEDEKIGHLDAIDMRGLDFDDPLWDTLLNQLTVEDMDELVRNGGYATIAIEQINLPATIFKDGPAGFSSTLVGGKSATAYPVQVVMGATWNTELMERVGVAIGNDSIHIGVTGWYAPGVNLHRLPFGGRNFEYFSEDSFLSAKLNASEIKGVQSKGVIVTMKHYALNDTETNRIGGAMFANEQSIRELYLRPFEQGVRDADASGVMTAMNRIGGEWAGAHYGLMTGTLRNEWGFNGVATTDQASFATFAYADYREGLAAGTNLWLNTDSTLWKLEDDEYNATVVNQLRNATRSILYRIVNSNAMNGLGKGDTVSRVRPQWMYWLYIATVILGLIAILLFIIPTRGIIKSMKRMRANRLKNK
ncbi:glycoside hydrolase family 3 protein [Streptococcus suis]|uniref:Glycoside hydrolase family 3 N-terminal domain-containing protein n=1 Tax=Streptococcus iners subsp. hyiners TaxID=3028083 RepID=A0AA96VHH6_9STRE|nr:glycoside hydrolase family 3 N-terminal domain-containing protein [Streptococcus sp. 29892]WNY49047.1 glycoside hydrolase family 3 N-terminal domain-containing protein [Streptococcus sp. 29892]HEM6271430.1 glycoside hydrolase family 3 protein [Streptococcus suis]HEM6340931.1 glycoside hydrolase family 3 protein [Streptococcus suis]